MHALRSRQPPYTMVGFSTRSSLDADGVLAASLDSQRTETMPGVRNNRCSMQFSTGGLCESCYLFKLKSIYRGHRSIVIVSLDSTGHLRRCRLESLSQISRSEVVMRMLTELIVLEICFRYQCSASIHAQLYCYRCVGVVNTLRLDALQVTGNRQDFNRFHILLFSAFCDARVFGRKYCSSMAGYRRGI